MYRIFLTTVQADTLTILSGFSDRTSVTETFRIHHFIWSTNLFTLSINFSLSWRTSAHIEFLHPDSSSRTSHAIAINNMFTFLTLSISPEPETWLANAFIINENLVTMAAFANVSLWIGESSRRAKTTNTVYQGKTIPANTLHIDWIEHLLGFTHIWAPSIDHLVSILAFAVTWSSTVNWTNRTCHTIIVLQKETFITFRTYFAIVSITLLALTFPSLGVVVFVLSTGEDALGSIKVGSSFTTTTY